MLFLTFGITGMTLEIVGISTLLHYTVQVYFKKKQANLIIYSQGLFFE